MPDFKGLLAGKGPVVLGGLLALGGGGLAGAGYTGHVQLTAEQGGEIAGFLGVLAGILLVAVRAAFHAKPPEPPAKV